MGYFMRLSIWQSDLSTVDTRYVVFASSTEQADSFSIFSRVDASGTYFFKLTEQYRNIPLACYGLFWETFCKFCQNHGVIRVVAEIQNE